MRWQERSLPLSDYRIRRVGYHHDLIPALAQSMRAFFPTRTNVAGIEISGGSGFRISNTKVAGGIKVDNASN
jgi:hypothetical protein